MLVAICGTLIYLDVSVTTKIVEDAAEFKSSGSSTYLISAPGSIDGRSCEQLARLEGIIGAGALRVAAAQSTIRALPQSGVTFREMSPGFTGVLSMIQRGKEESTGGVFVSEALAGSLGQAENLRSIATTQGNFPVAGVYRYPDDGRLPTLQNAVITSVPVGNVFDECWAVVWPIGAPVASLLRSTLTVEAPAVDSARVQQLNSRLGDEFDGASRFEQRPTRYLPLACLVFSICIGFFSVWFRRLEFASARHVGVRVTDQAVQVAIETLAWCISAFCVTAAWLACWTMGAMPDVHHFLTRLGLQTFTLGGVGAMLGAVAAVLQTRERHLFRYFKQR
ncbi:MULTISPECIES: hypothetical protein [Micromonospora]|uniref:hypothetical protein n=1 Tax=Micromonospora TaxID=1873 RepID=UPI0033D3DD68